jgi:uncharacterized damage-inducible protein DinB
MDMKDFFKDLFHYNYSTNQKLWDAFQANAGKTSERVLALYSHIVNAHQIWNNRIDKRLTAFGVWDLHTLEACRDIDQANYEHTLQILNTLDLNATVNFTMRGKACHKKGVGPLISYHQSFYVPPGANCHRLPAKRNRSVEYGFYSV